MISKIFTESAADLTKIIAFIAIIVGTPYLFPPQREGLIKYGHIGSTTFHTICDTDKTKQTNCPGTNFVVSTFVAVSEPNVHNDSVSITLKYPTAINWYDFQSWLPNHEPDVDSSQGKIKFLLPPPSGNTPCITSLQILQKNNADSPIISVSDQSNKTIFFNQNPSFFASHNYLPVAIIWSSILSIFLSRIYYNSSRWPSKTKSPARNSFKSK